MTDPAFTEAMRSVAEAFFKQHREKVLAKEAARAQWRQEREKARRPMRCYYLALARGELPEGDWEPPGTDY
jgi:hypothetical protein